MTNTNPNDASRIRSLKQLRNKPANMRLLIDQVTQELEIRNSHPDMAGLRTGVQSVDEKSTSTFEPGTLTVVGAETGAGKTMMLTQMALAMCSQAPVLFLSLEDAPEDIVCRMLAAMTGYDVGDVRAGFSRSAPRSGLPSPIVDALSWLMNANLTIIGGDAVDTRWVIQEVRTWWSSQDDPFGAVLIDQFSEVAYPQDSKATQNFWLSVPPPNRFASDHNKLEWNALALRQLALDVNCSMIVASQLNRERDGDNRPTNDSFRGSSGISHKADTTMLLSRSRDNSGNDSDDDGPIKVILDVRKSRRGAVFATELVADRAHQRFLDPDVAVDSSWAPQPAPSPSTLEGRRSLARIARNRSQWSLQPGSNSPASDAEDQEAA